MPPIKFLFSSTISKLVAVPRSITIAGSLYKTAAALAFAILSAPASFGCLNSILTVNFAL